METNEVTSGEVTNHFTELNKIDISKYVEIKEVKYNDRNSGQQRVIRLKYLSWAYAITEIKKRDPQANWVFLEPIIYSDRTMMVHCNFTCFGVTHYMWLPVINQKNQPIQNPNAFDINTAMMRCLVKAIAVHGLGLYIYAGEDLPEDDQGAQGQQNQQNQQQQQSGGSSSGIGRTDQQLAQDLQVALAEIDKAVSPEQLDYPCDYFKGTKHEQTIRKACTAKMDREGWSE